LIAWFGLFRLDGFLCARQRFPEIVARRENVRALALREKLGN